MKHVYSNPRMEAVIADWPNGKHRVEARFSIETTKRGQRAVRQTTGAPKALTFARAARIVDGDDGRIYILNLTEYGHISIMQGTMKYQEETVFERDPGYAELRAMFDAVAAEG